MNTHYNMATSEYTREIVYEGIHLLLRFHKDMLDEYVLDAVLTPDGTNITDLIRVSALTYFETLIESN
jgi:hypothetical protein